MKRMFALTLALCLALTLFSAAAEEEKALNVFTWEGYIDENTLANFTAETGIAIRFATFGSNEEMLLKLQANGASEYDVILASDYILSAAGKQGLLMALDRAQLPNWVNLNPEYLNQYFDPENAYTMPYAAGTPMIVYDPGRVPFEITSYNDLWREELRDSLCLIDDARVMIGAVLKSLGYSMNTTDEKELAEAAEKLYALKPNVRVLDYDTGYAQLLSGEAAVGYLFTPFVVICQMENPDLVAVFPEEGVGYGIDSLAIPANAPHPINAHLFLDYLLRPEVAAYVAEWQLYMNPNLAAEEFLSEGYKNSLAFHIPENLWAGKEYVMDLGESESLFQDIWLEFKLK